VRVVPVLLKALAGKRAKRLRVVDRHAVLHLGRRCRALRLGLRRGRARASGKAAPAAVRRPPCQRSRLGAGTRPHLPAPGCCARTSCSCSVPTAARPAPAEEASQVSMPTYHSREARSRLLRRWRRRNFVSRKRERAASLADSRRRSAAGSPPGGGGAGQAGGRGVWRRAAGNPGPGGAAPLGVRCVGRGGGRWVCLAGHPSHGGPQLTVQLCCPPPRDKLAGKPTPWPREGVGSSGLPGPGGDRHSSRLAACAQPAAATELSTGCGSPTQAHAAPHAAGGRAQQVGAATLILSGENLAEAGSSRAAAVESAAAAQGSL
jgi:hypothetical protein